MRVLAEKNHFTLINSDIHNKTRPNKNEQVRYTLPKFLSVEENSLDYDIQAN